MKKNVLKIKEKNNFPFKHKKKENNISSNSKKKYINLEWIKVKFRN